MILMKTSALIHNDLMSPAAEAYRLLRTNLQFSGIDRDIKSIVITSTEAGEGKSTVAINLAFSMAQINKKVLLVDSDLRRPSIHAYLGLDNGCGLTNVIAGGMEYWEVLRNIDGVGNLDILCSGPVPPNPSELLGSARMKSILNRLETEYQMILFDSPPAAVVADTAVLASITDGIVLVCGAGKTRIQAVQKTKAILQKVNANILGVVINKIPVSRHKYKKNYYYADAARKQGKRRKGKKDV